MAASLPTTEPAALHPWDLPPRQARELQVRLAARIETSDRLGPVARVAGVDVGFVDGGRTARAAVAVLSWPQLVLLESAVVRVPVSYPYVPGLLTFRELPAVLAAWRQLTQLPDLVLCDGQGRAHPRRIGFASHLGLWLDVPSIGVAKTRLIGTHGEVPPQKGQWTPLLDGEEVIGAVLRTRPGVKPLYVSIGHRVSLETAIAWTLACTTRYRLPETTRQAHHLASG
jgi:deoxyribonuclease V